jgi:hypothetical protein
LEHFEIVLTYSQALIPLIESGNGALIKKLLPLVRSLDGHFDRGWGYLHYAANYGHLSIVKILCDAGADPNISNSRQLTPLHYACRYGYAGVARHLLDHGANIDQVDSYGRSPIFEAVLSGDPSGVAVLVDRGANLGLSNTRGHLPINLLKHLSIDNRRHSGVIHDLLQGKFDNIELVRPTVNPLRYTEVAECLQSQFGITELQKLSGLNASDREGLCQEVMRLVRTTDEEGNPLLTGKMVFLECLLCGESLLGEETFINLSCGYQVHVSCLEDHLESEESCPRGCDKPVFIV